MLKDTFACIERAVLKHVQATDPRGFLDVADAVVMTLPATTVQDVEFVMRCMLSERKLRSRGDDWKIEAIAS